MGGTLEALTCAWWLPVGPWAAAMHLAHDVLLVLVQSPLPELGCAGYQFLPDKQAPNFTCFSVNSSSSC